MSVSLAGRPAATVAHDSRFMKLVYNVLRPLVRLALRMGMTTYELCETVRWLAVDIALHDPEFAVKGRNVHSQTKSHAAVFTGLPRREVMRLCALPKPDLEHYAASYHRAARVLAGWVEDADFQDENGKPREMPVRSVQEVSFAKLCQRYARDVPPRALLDQLVQRGNVTKLPGNRVKLENPVFLFDETRDEDYEITATVCGDFMNTMDRFLANSGEFQPRFRETYFTSVPKARLSEFRTLAHERLQKATEDFDQLLKDFNEPGLPEEKTARAGVGLFSFFDN